MLTRTLLPIALLASTALALSKRQSTSTLEDTLSSLGDSPNSDQCENQCNPLLAVALGCYDTAGDDEAAFMACACNGSFQTSLDSCAGCLGEDAPAKAQEFAALCAATSASSGVSSAASASSTGSAASSAASSASSALSSGSSVLSPLASSASSAVSSASSAAASARSTSASGTVSGSAPSASASGDSAAAIGVRAAGGAAALGAVAVAMLV